MRGCGWRKRRGVRGREGVCAGGVGEERGVRGWGWIREGCERAWLEGGVGGREGCDRVWLEEEKGCERVGLEEEKGV